MSEDISERLRKMPVRVQLSGSWERDCYEAADEIARLRGEVEDLRKWRQTTTALISERDAALARAEAAERERDEAKEQLRLANIDCFNTEVRADAAEAKVAKLREVLLPFADIGEWSEDFFDASMASVDVALGDLRRARAVLQETNDVD